MFAVLAHNWWAPLPRAILSFAYFQVPSKYQHRVLFWMPVTNRYHGQNFFVREAAGAGARLFATPLFVVLVLVETADLVFAVDSIPAVFAVTGDPFLVYTSMLLTDVY